MHRSGGVIVRKTLVLTLCLSAFVTSVRAAKPVKPAKTPDTATLHCPVDPGCVMLTTPDRIQGDPVGPYVGNTTTGLGAFLNESNDFLLSLSASGGQPLGQRLFLDFREPVSTPPCTAANTLKGEGRTEPSCRRVEPFYFDTVTAYESPFGDLVNPVNASGVDLENGLLDVVIGTTVQAKVKINFPDPYGRDLIWTVRFNPVNYPGSSYVSVTRTTGNIWIVESTSTTPAKLVAPPGGDTRDQTDEGLFLMPFLMTIVK
jgi:hypothetical protein